MEKDFLKWYKTNETKFHQFNFSEKEIAYSSWLASGKGKLDNVFKIMKKFVEEEIIDSDYTIPGTDPQKTLKNWWNKNKSKYGK